MKTRAAQTRYCLLLVWLSFGSLVLLQLLDTWLQQFGTIVYFIKVLPLLIFLPGMRRDQLRSFIWLCFVCLIYFMLLVVRLFAKPGDIVSLLGMISLVTLFISSMMYVRWRARELREEVVDE